MEYSALHEHLDGGLRAKTIIEIAESKNIPIPTKDEEELRNWFLKIYQLKKNKYLKNLR